MSEKVVEHLKLIHSLVRSFDKREVTVLQNFLTAFESRQKGFKPKGLMLTELILKHDDPTDVLTRFRKKLGKDSLNGARMHVHRLRDKIFEAMALEINILKSDSLSLAAKGQYQILHKRYVAQLLDNKGHRELSNRVLDQAIKHAKEFEFYSDLIELLLLKLERLRGPALVKDYEQVRSELAFYQDCQKSIWEARTVIETLLKSRLKLVSLTDPTGQHKGAVAEALPRLEEIFETTGSAKIGIHYYTFKCELLQLESDYEGAREPFRMWLDLLENNVAIRGDNRLALIRLNMGQNSIYAYQFNEANAFLAAGYEFIQSESKLYYTANEQEFYALYYNGKVDEAVAVSDSMVKAAELHGFKNKGPLWNFFAAAAAFCSGNLKAARRYLLDTGALRSDREGFNIAIRAFEIILDIDGEKFDVADSQINNLRQFMKEGLKGSVIRKRDEHILQILLDLRRASYRFEDLEDSSLDLWRELFGKEDEVKWIPECAELVPFHLWFSYKHQGKPYDPKLTSELIHTPYI